MKHRHIRTVSLHISMMTHVNDVNYVYVGLRTCLAHSPNEFEVELNLVPEDPYIAEYVVT